MKKILGLVLISLTILGITYYIINKPIDNEVITEPLVYDLEVGVYEHVSLRDKYNIDTDYTIFEKELGEKTYEFEYRDGSIKNGTINVHVIDNIKPFVMLFDSYTISQDYKGKLEEDIFCIDNYSRSLSINITGEYDVSKLGDYNLVYEVTDESGNKTIKPFTLKVRNYSYDDSYTYYEDIVNKYKNNKVGIDVSSWQGNINYNKLDVDFMMIRLGFQRDFNGSYEMDNRFYDNIKKANEHNIDAGVYFYSYASNVEDAKAQALFVIDKVKDYDIKLPIAFDFECFSEIENMNLYDLNEIANVFLSTIKENGYEAMLYGSRNYLTYLYDNDYLKWVAHYNDTTDYTNRYMWQLCADGIIDGIDGYVDIDVMGEV